MTIDLSHLDNAHRVLFEISLFPLQGKRFQPTGFPGLGAATFQTKDGQCLLVESAQSMANRLEVTIWDETQNDLKPEFYGLSHVRVMRGQGDSKRFLTDTVLESHRLNSPYVLDGQTESGAHFFDVLRETFKEFDDGFFDRKMMAREILRLDAGSLIHGAFLSQKRNKTSLAGGRLRVARALSAFIEADGVMTAPSGGVKNDHVKPSWPKTKVAEGYGNVPFPRDEFTADKITLYVNLDLAQIRGYGLGTEVERLLILLSLHRLRSLLDKGLLDLRTNCDLRVEETSFVATYPADFALPDTEVLTEATKNAIESCSDIMTVTNVTFNQSMPKSKVEEESEDNEDVDQGD